MSFRPLSTFQSEGWYKPSLRARSHHYFRQKGDRLVSLCGVHWVFETIRGSLTSRVGNKANECKKCAAEVASQMARKDGGWFDIPARLQLPS